MPHTDRRSPEESDIDLPVGDAVTEVWYNESDEAWYGADDYGEFQMARGSAEPVSHDEYAYTPCNCIVSHSEARYTEKRFCRAPAMSNGACKSHQAQVSEGFVTHNESNLSNAAEIKSHKTLFRYMDPYQKVVANDLYVSLVQMSEYDFLLQTHQLHVDTSDSDVFEDDSIYLRHPVPKENRIRCKALWYAALDFLTAEMMRRERFKTAFEQSRDDAVAADDVTVGERWTVVASGDNGPVYDKEEHHLNLPLSRIQGNYEEELEFGGVAVDGELDSSDDMDRDWNVTIVDETADAAGIMQDEAHPDDPSPLEDVTPET
jgi:hypothetical protein